MTLGARCRPPRTGGSTRTTRCLSRRRGFGVAVASGDRRRLRGARRGGLVQRPRGVPRSAAS
eukprot:ctg_492.g225